MEGGSMEDDTPDTFEPNGWEVARHDGERIKLIFHCDDGVSRAAILPRSTIPGLIARLVAEIGPGQGVPIAGSLRPGLTIQIQGFGACRHSDGGANLTIFAHLPDEDRDVTIPLPLSTQNVVELLDLLSLPQAE
jgi:hypothetical protein